MTRFFTNKVVVITGLLMLGFFETFITLVAWCQIMLIVISMAIKDEVIDSINKFKNKKQ